MASTYALPLNPAAQSHTLTHAHSRSHNFSDRRPSWNGSINNSSPAKSQSAHPHAHHLSDVNGQLPTSPYANGHDQSRSIDSSFTLKPFMGRPRGRPRGESDLGRPPSRKSATTGKFGFSPIQEALAPPPSPTDSWLDLPEGLAALLTTLPFLFASLAYPNVVARARWLPSALGSAQDRLLETVENESDPFSSQVVPRDSPLLHACTLTSTALILVGIISKLRPVEDQPLDRRKSFANTGQTGLASNVVWGPASILRICTSILSVLLPFYATMQLGGARTALFLLIATAGGLGALDHKLGKHSLSDVLKRTLRTRKATAAILALASVTDLLTSAERLDVSMGYMALLTCIMAIPPPLPTAGWSLSTSANGTPDSRISLPKPSSPLIGTSTDSSITICAGGFLTVLTILFSFLSSSSPSIAHHAIFFSTLSVASAMALVFFAIPSALRSQKKLGLALGSLVTIAFEVWDPLASWQTWMFVSLTAALACTPGSIIHSILLEKDSRRIAYFGMLNMGFMLVQFFYGFVSGSLGLLTDSIHMLFDCAGLAVGLAAAVMSKWPPNARFPYGYGKIDTLSGFANGVFLMLVSVEIIFDAFERLWEGHELQRLNELLIVSILGFLVNIVGLTAFGHAHHGHGHDHGHGDHDHGHGHSHDNENMHGIFLHIMADALGSVAVIISTLLAKFYGWSGWDPIASCIIAVLIFGSAVPLVKSAGMRLLLSLPADVEYGVRNTLQELSSLRGVVGYAVPRFWLQDEGAAHADHEHEHDHDHDHDHSHGPQKQKVLGVIHVIAAKASDLEDVRERTVQFLKGRGMDVVAHVEYEGEGKCWCGGGNKTS
ncbi:hypothetical protein EJ04DRAFT_484271 [Polyplosphaeria fusca]|uniref:Zinc transporter n=1 Tax=Polyplosphaeria fusca TaxID=682080 RepID=A0A9P4R7C4_9PLEO|nr:hypothetical protein EJ04DRAFT_484271 [Polyplosphaeria fusca]